MRTLLIGSALWVAACGAGTGEHECSDVGCLNEASLTIHPDDAAWIEGAYVLTISTDDLTNTCELHIPDNLPGLGATSTIQCDHELAIYFAQDVRCNTVRATDTSSNACVPLDDRFTLQASLRGTPGSIAARLERDGAVVLEQTTTPSYQTSRPNGPDCGPVCESAEVDLTF